MKSKIAFCVAEDFNLGAGYIISHLKKEGHEVKLFFDPLQFNRGYAQNKFLAKLLSIENYNIKSIKKFNPDVCCFTCVTATYKWALRIAERIKKEVGCKIIFGGVHATLVPEELKHHNFIDEIVEGDGLLYFGNKQFNPDEIWADREIFFKELPSIHRQVQLFMTSFGCAFNCSFCGNEQLRKIKKFKIIRRSVDGCLKELEYLKVSGMKYVLFVDDIFTLDKKWLLEFLPKYKEQIGLPFSCFVHAKFIDDEIVIALKNCGCHSVWMGIQSGFEALRRDILNRNETNKEIVDSCIIIKKHGLKLIIDHIFGIPYESEITNDISYNLYRLINPDIVNCYELVYFPKAKIIEFALKFGYLKHEDITKINRGEGIIYQQGNRNKHFFDMYAKSFISIPLKSIISEFLPTWLIKLIIYAKIGRLFTPFVMIQNELFFTWKAIQKKVRLK